MACSVCGNPLADTEMLQFAGERHHNPEHWRVGEVCRECRENKLLPTLRRLMADSPFLTRPADDEDLIHSVEKDDGVVFRSFVNGTTRHVAREVLTGAPLGWRSYCVALCGIEAFAEPRAEKRALKSQREAISLCGRCESVNGVFFS